MGKLSATAVKAASRPGKLGDGDGLYLVVKSSGTKSWMVRVQKNGNRRDFGLGGASKISLAVARERAREVRTWVELGLDPLFERRKAEGIPTFREAAAKVLAQHRATWRNEKHEKQWIRTLEAYAFPHLGNVQVNDITGPMIRNVLAEIWLAKPETARRVRQRIGTVLDWAYASGYRDSEAPMRAITKGLPRQPKKEGHYAAMAYAKVPDFIPRLRERESYSRLALEFAILTGARSGEVRHAVFDEFDLDEKLWTIPKERMKANREHVVPLCDRAIRIIERCMELRIRNCELIFPGMMLCDRAAWVIICCKDQRVRNCELVFPGMRGRKAMSDMTLTKLLREMKESCTVHGFRSAFRDWASEETSHQSDVAEAALAHVVKDKTEAAYRRGNLLEKRKLLMEDWAAHCCKGS